MAYICGLARRRNRPYAFPFSLVLLTNIISSTWAQQTQSWTILLPLESSSSIASTTSLNRQSSFLTLFARSSTPIAAASPSETSSTTPASTSSINNGYYFVLIAVLIILVAATICTIYNRRSRMSFAFLSPVHQRPSTGIHTANPSTAAGTTASHAEFDISSWQNRRRRHLCPTQPSGSAWLYYNRRTGQFEEGLNEAGEAPPPYEPGTKPPSIEHVYVDTIEGSSRIGIGGDGSGTGTARRADPEEETRPYVSDTEEASPGGLERPAPAVIARGPHI